MAIPTFRSRAPERLAAAARWSGAAPWSWLGLAGSDRSSGVGPEMTRVDPLPTERWLELSVGRDLGGGGGTTLTPGTTAGDILVWDGDRIVMFQPHEPDGGARQAHEPVQVVGQDQQADQVLAAPIEPSHQASHALQHRLASHSHGSLVLRAGPPAIQAGGR